MPSAVGAERVPPHSTPAATGVVQIDGVMRMRRTGAGAPHHDIIRTRLISNQAGPAASVQKASRVRMMS